MSIFSAMVVGTTGLQAQSNKIDVISTNLANVNTVGYKAGMATFATLLDSADAGYTPGGVDGGQTSSNDVQGTIVPGDQATDIAISGGGFLPVSASSTSASSNILYTRAGSFTKDKNGDLVNGAGYFLQGWPIQADGNVAGGLTGDSVPSASALSGLQTVNVANLNETPVPTTDVALHANLDAGQLPYSSFDIAIKANLQASQAAYAGPPTYDPTSATANMASGSVAPQFTAPITVTDSNGTAHTLRAGFLKTAADTWAVEVYANPAGDVTNAGGQIGAGTLTFNSDGSLASVSASLSQSLNADWSDNAGPSTLTINWGTAGVPGIGQSNGVSQLGAAYALTSVQTQTYDPVTDSMASGAVAPQFSAVVPVVDSKGNMHNLNVGFLKTATSTWAVEVYANPASDVSGATNGQLATGTLTFNGDGSLASVSPALSQIGIGWSNGAAGSSIAMNWGTAGVPFGTAGATLIGKTDGVSQFNGAFKISGIDQNGVDAGVLTSLDITTDGYVQGNYSNGSSRNLYRIPLAQFVNPDQLQSLTGNVFATTKNTAPFSFVAPGQTGGASLQGNSLENSNVDQATQLTDLMVAQQAYQFNTKLISTSESMLQSLTSMGTN